MRRRPLTWEEVHDLKKRLATVLPNGTSSKVLSLTDAQFGTLAAVVAEAEARLEGEAQTELGLGR